MNPMSKSASFHIFSYLISDINCSFRLSPSVHRNHGVREKKPVLLCGPGLGLGVVLGLIAEESPEADAVSEMGPLSTAAVCDRDWT